MTQNGAADYRYQAWDFLAKSKKYLADGDLHQASEKGWGAAAHMAKAVAAVRGWEYHTHDQFFSVMDNARHALRQSQLRNLADAANTLHGNFYKRKVLLSADTIREGIDDVESMLNILQPLVD